MDISELVDSEVKICKQADCVPPNSIADYVRQRLSKDRESAITDLIAAVPFPQRMVRRLCDHVLFDMPVGSMLDWVVVSKEVLISAGECKDIWNSLCQPYNNESLLVQRLVKANSSTSSSPSTSPPLKRREESLKPKKNVKGSSGPSALLQRMLLSSIRSDLLRSNEDTRPPRLVTSRVMERDIDLLASLVWLDHGSSKLRKPDWLTQDAITLFLAVRACGDDWQEVAAKVGLRTSHEAREKWGTLVERARTDPSVPKQKTASPTISRRQPIANMSRQSASVSALDIWSAHTNMSGLKLPSVLQGHTHFAGNLTSLQVPRVLQ